MMELTIHIVYLASATALLTAMARWDVLMLRENDFIGSQYLSWFRETEESFSIKRIIALAAIFVSMANLGVYVEAFVAVVLIVLTVFLLGKRGEKTSPVVVPLWRPLVMELAPMLILVAVVALFGAGDIDQSLVWAARVALLLTVLSSAFALFACKLCGRSKPQINENQQQTEI